MRGKGKGMRAGLQGCVRHLAGQGPTGLQDCVRRLGRAKKSREESTVQKEHGIDPHPDTQSEPWKVTASSTVRSSENMLGKLVDSVPCDPAVAIPRRPSVSVHTPNSPIHNGLKGRWRESPAREQVGRACLSVQRILGCQRIGIPAHSWAR